MISETFLSTHAFSPWSLWDLCFWGIGIRKLIRRWILRTSQTSLTNTNNNLQMYDPTMTCDLCVKIFMIIILFTWVSSSIGYIRDHDRNPYSLPISSAWIFGCTYLTQILHRHQHRSPSREVGTCRRVRGQRGPYFWGRFHNVAVFAAGRCTGVCRFRWDSLWGPVLFPAFLWWFPSNRSFQYYYRVIQQ